MLLWSLLLAPLGLPVLAPEAMARYTATSGIVPQIERGEGFLQCPPVYEFLATRR